MKKAITHALTIRQPFAELILRGEKTEEFRTWAPRREFWKTEIAIHSALKVSREALAEHRMDRDTLVRGAIVGVVTIATVQYVEEDPDEPIFYAWLLTGARRLAKPVEMPGRLGLWRLPSEFSRHLV